ncbi:metallophosphoesterase [Persephonella sp.]
MGDIHGCLLEFEKLVDKLEKDYGKDILIISLGDTVDRGDYNIETVKFCIDLKKEGNFIEVESNHNLKFAKWLDGKEVNISHGMQKTVSQFEKLSDEEKEEFRKEYLDYYLQCPVYVVINNEVIAVHAGIKDSMIGKIDNKIRKFSIYGETTGRYTELGFPERIDWTKNRKVTENSPKIVYGHVVYNDPYINNNCYGIDTGCVLGNKLTGYIPCEDRFIFIKAEKRYFTFL